ncbi:APC family permease [Streptomyces ipomoeae]|uniref:APC family permease n=1 Tax=Streptomyces ipomoeae TaxID=103232 RepID=UPI00114626B2|nr:APC family permease [Streptomyces ipomoeae]TQE19894.1 APC family permease [Streptomyces ipomoeae]
MKRRLPWSVTGGASSESRALSGHMGTRALTLTVLAFSAPISVVSAYLPYSISFGGKGAAFAFAAATVVLLFFAVGYVTMARHVPKPGDFYSFISTGLGKVVGLGAGLLAVTTYVVLLAGVYAQLGVTVQNLIVSLDGPNTPWLVWTVLGWAVVSVLGYLHIELSAKILSIAMVVEVVVVMTYDVAVLIAGGGPDGLTARPLSPFEFTRGDVGVAILFAILLFLGFEATALFRDEVRNPNKTIPRATYTAVVFVGLLYLLSCYALMSAYGAKAVSVATNAPTTMFPDSIGHYVAPAFTQLSYLFVTTSVLAALLAIHNVVARYVHNLSCDRALPGYLADVHRRHGSPHRASTLAAIVTAVVLLAFVVAGSQGPSLYAELTGLGAAGILLLMTMVSLAVIVWFGRTGVPAGENWFKVFLAPGIAAASLGGTVFLALTHFELIVGGAPGQNLWLVGIPLVGLCVGIALALYFRSRRRHVYDRLGRADRGIDLTDET